MRACLAGLVPASGVAAIAAAAVLAVAATAQTLPRTSDWPVEGVRARIGASVAEVQRAYGIADEPKPNASRVNPGATSLEIPGEGLVFNFNEKKCVYGIRFSAGFAGNVAGVTLADTLSSLTHKLGSPARTPFDFGGSELAYLYDVAPSITGRFDVSRTRLAAGQIKRVFVFVRRGSGHPLCSDDLS